MLTVSAAFSDSILSSAVYEPRSHMETSSRLQVVPEICTCVNWAVDRLKAVKCSPEQWSATAGVTPSSVDSASRSGVRTSSIVEEGGLEYVPVSSSSVSAPGGSSLRVSSGKSEKRKLSQSAVKFPRRFEVASPSGSPPKKVVVEDSSFGAALDRQQSHE